MKNSVFLMLLCFTISCAAAVPITTTVSSNLATKVAEIHQTLHPITSSSKVDMDEVARLIRKEIDYVSRPIRKQRNFRSWCGSGMLLSVIVMYQPLMKKSIFSVISALFLGMSIQSFFEIQRMRLETKFQPTDPRFAAVSDLSNFEWEIVKKLDLLMTTAYENLSADEKTMADALFTQLNQLFPTEYDHISKLRVNELVFTDTEHLAEYIVANNVSKVARVVLPVEDCLMKLLSSPIMPLK